MAKAGSGKRTISVVSTIVSICLVLFLYGLLGIFLIKANELKKILKESIELKVMFRESVSSSEASRWHNVLSGRAYIKSARLISKEEALENMKSEHGDDIIDILGANPLPYSIDVNIYERFAITDSLSVLKAEIEADPKVREVVYQADLVENIDRNVQRVTIAMVVVVFLFLLIAIALINSTIRLTIYSRRFLVKSMQLVGATRSFIRRPFIWQSIVNGVLSGVLAISILVALLYAIQESWPGLISVNDATSVSLLFASVLALGFIISAISSYFAINRYLNLKLEELY